MQPNFVTKSVVARERLITIEGTGPALDVFASLRLRIIADIDRETATLFAEPVMTDRGDSLEVAWYTEHGGVARPLDTLDAGLQVHIAAKLRARLEKLRPLLASDIAPVLWCALQVARPQSVLAIGDEPVLVEWGVAPEGERANPAGTADRFSKVIGPYSPFAYLTPQTARRAPPLTEPSTLPPVGVTLQPPPSTGPKGLAIATIVAAVCAVLLSLPGVLALAGSDDVDTATAITRAMREKVDRARAALGSFDCGPDGAATPASTNPDLPPQPIPTGGTTPHPEPKTPDGKSPPTPGEAAATGNPMALVARRATESVVYILTCSDAATWLKKIGEMGIAKAKPQACPVKTDQAGNPVDLVALGSGSGFFIGPDRIVTNEHVVQDAKAIIVASQSLAMAVPAIVVAATTTTGPDADFAVLSVSVPKPPPPIALSAQVYSLQNVVAAGYPGIIVDAAAELGSSQGQHSLPDLTTFPGYITVLKNTDGDLPFIITSAVIGHGNSGGPLLDLCASALGVNTLGWSGDKEDAAYKVNVAEGVKALESFLDAHSIPYQKADGPCGGPAGKPTSPTNTRK